LVTWWAPQRKYAVKLQRSRVLSIDGESHASRQIAREYPRIPANTPRIPTENDREYPANTHKWTHSSPLTHALETFISPSDARLSCPRLCPPTAWAGGRAVRPACGLSVRLSVGRSTGPPVGRSGDPSAPSVRRPVDVYVCSSVCPSVRWSDVPPVRPSVHSLLGRWVGWSVGRNRR